MEKKYIDSSVIINVICFLVNVMVAFYGLFHITDNKNWLVAFLVSSMASIYTGYLAYRAYQLNKELYSLREKLKNEIS